jgi:hypothetical protein
MTRRWLLFFTLLLSTFILAQATSAQNEIQLDQLEIDLWPEYDQPSMLVIYQATLPENISLPVQLTFRIPAAAGSPNAVAVRSPGEGLLNAPYDQQLQGEWIAVTFTATFPEIQLEYYDPGLAKEGPSRSYTFSWPGDYAVQSLSLQVQQPIGAENMQISPSLGSGSVQADGMTYYEETIGALDKGQTFTLSVSYQKASDSLSINAFQVQPSQPLTTDTAGRVKFADYLPWILGIAGILMVVGGGLWFWQSGKTQPPREKRRRKIISRPAPEEEVSRYCPQCGKRAQPGDRFCRACGTQLG